MPVRSGTPSRAQARFTLNCPIPARKSSRNMRPPGKPPMPHHVASIDAQDVERRGKQDPPMDQAIWAASFVQRRRSTSSSGISIVAMWTWECHATVSAAANNPQPMRPRWRDRSAPQGGPIVPSAASDVTDRAGRDQHAIAQGWPHEALKVQRQSCASSS